MRVTDGNRQRIGGIRTGKLNPRQLKPNHMRDLRLVGMPDADHGLLDRIRGVFADLKPGLRNGKHRNAPRLAQLQRTGTILIDKSLLNRGAVGGLIGQNPDKTVMQRQQPRSHIHAV